MNSARDKRIMIFTSLLRTLNFVGHSRVDQCYKLFLKFEEQHPLTNSYMKTGRAVDHDLPTEPLEFFKSRGWDADSYPLDEIEEVVKELPEEFSNECNKCFDGKVDVVKAMNGGRVCDDCLIQDTKLGFYKTNQEGVYKYENHDQLQKLYDILDNPISYNFDTCCITHKIDTKVLKHPFGLVHTWSNMDDFSDYPLNYCAIIDGAYIENIKGKHNG